jgi:hypothetical protein
MVYTVLVLLALFYVLPVAAVQGLLQVCYNRVIYHYTVAIGSWLACC